MAEAQGDVEGRGLALVNVRFDTDAPLNVLLLYTKPTVFTCTGVAEVFK